LSYRLEYPVQKVRVNIGSTTSTWDGIDSVQLTGKTLVSAELPARTINVSTPNCRESTVCEYLNFMNRANVVDLSNLNTCQLTGKTLVSAELPARTDTAISYNNLKDKPTIPTLPPPLMSISAMSLGEKLLKAVSVRAVFSALVTCAGNVSPPVGA
jgi:hypothetical protein